MVVAGKTYLLQTGDSLAFKSHLPHRWENASDEETRVLWTISPLTAIC
jgi:quercetin dioxygenase-like cupin family protein